MNILIPDSWLREFLKTDATPAEIREYLSLCGPSVERVQKHGKETVYDIEITTNRVDSYSVMGVAREAVAILPRFGKKAEWIHTPVTFKNDSKAPLGIEILDPGKTCRRILGIKISGITLAESPEWLKKRLELVGQRSINNIVDITNYVMWECGHPVHAFDYDRLTTHAIHIREARKGETVVSLDKKEHTLIGGEVIFDDGTGRIIDIPGIMGTANTVVTPETKNVLLFVENSDPSKIRFTSMAHAIRTQAAVINEKDPDTELAFTAIRRAAELALDITKGKSGSVLYDSYPTPFVPYTVSVTRKKLDAYLGTPLSQKEIHRILTALGFKTEQTPDDITVTVPSFRKDVSIDVDIIEEIARIYGYHAIETHLPSTEPPVVMPDKILTAEEDIKIRLRDWGYTEMITYSLISKPLMDAFSEPVGKSYTVVNPLSADWEYLRPHAAMSLLDAVAKTITTTPDIRIFELSNSYALREGDLPAEIPTLTVVWSGEQFAQAKGIAAELFDILGIRVSHTDSLARMPYHWFTGQSYSFGPYGALGVVKPDLLRALSIAKPLTLLTIDFARAVNDGTPGHAYGAVSKFPSAYEDIAFTVGTAFEIGPFMESLARAHSLIRNVTLLDIHGSTRTVRVEYLDRHKNLTADDIRPAREAVLLLAKHTFSATLKK